MDDKDPFTFHMRMPTQARPLLGLTVLVVEDSRFASEALRLMCLRSGARIRRADCLKSAHRHLQVYRPAVAIIDIGLRDGSGADLIAELTRVSPRSNVVIGMSGDPDGEATSLNAGADAFLAKPATSLAQFQELILAHMPAERRPLGPRVVPDENIDPDPIAYQDDLAHVADVISNGADEPTLDYITQFLSGVAKAADDRTMMNAVDDLRKIRANGQSNGSAFARLAGLVHERLEDKIAL